jgi:hypothetical protein
VRAKLDPCRQPGKPHRGDDRGAARREHALIVVRVARVECLRHGEVHDRVAEELEALVVAARRLGMLVEPAGVDEGLLQQVQVTNREPEAFREGGGPAHRCPG